MAVISTPKNSEPLWHADISRDPKKLLFAHESAVPKTVAQVTDYLRDHNLWYLLSRNPRVTSCRDAAANRLRLGKKGIPLHSELKSFLGEYEDRNGDKQYAAIHSRGTDELDLEKIVRVLDISSHFQRLNGDDIYGLVNPFLLSEGVREKPVLQVFDQSLLLDQSLPGTMMTNAGDYTWSVEFYVKELLMALGEGAKVADVIDGSPQLSTSSKIGILTGNPPESGSLFMKYLIDEFQKSYEDLFQGDVSTPFMNLHSSPALGLTMELHFRKEKVWDLLEKDIVNLVSSGATILCVPCNTTPYFDERFAALAQTHGVEYVSMPKVVVDNLRERKVQEVCLLGLGYANDLRGYSPYRKLADFLSVEKLSPKTLEMVADLTYSIKQEGPQNHHITRLESLLSKHVKSNVVILGLTEFSMVRDIQRKDRRSPTEVIDPMLLYAQAVAKVYIQKTHPPESL